MIRGAVNLTRYKHKLREIDSERLYDVVGARVGKAFKAGFVALIQHTPVDTGFLRASWWIDIGTEGEHHVRPPSYALKRQIDNRRYWRRGPSGLEPEFVKSLLAQVKYSQIDYALGNMVPDIAGQSSIVAVSQVVYVNKAPYADIVDDSTGFSEVALAAARIAIKTTAARWRMDLRRR